MSQCLLDYCAHDSPRHLPSKLTGCRMGTDATVPREAWGIPGFLKNCYRFPTSSQQDHKARFQAFNEFLRVKASSRRGRGGKAVGRGRGSEMETHTYNVPMQRFHCSLHKYVWILACLHILHRYIILCIQSDETATFVPLLLAGTWLMFHLHCRFFGISPGSKSRRKSYLPCRRTLWQGTSSHLSRTDATTGSCRFATCRTPCGGDCLLDVNPRG